MSKKSALKMLSARNGLRDARYFAGRRQELSSLETRLSHPFDPVWIHGPHRIGKSALAWMGARYAEEEGAKVIEVDVIDCRTLDEALVVALRAAHGRDARTVKAPRDELRGLAKEHEERGLVVVFDEFDAVAVNLQTEEQAYLRKLVSEVDGLGLVFVTTQPPSSVMEEVPDKASRLSGVCKVHRVVPLERGDVLDLCEKVAADMEQDVLRSSAVEIWERVGGFTMASVAFLESLARRVECGEQVDEYALDETLLELDTDVIPHFRRYFAGLRIESRLVAAGRLDPRKAQKALAKDKLWGRQGFIGYRLLREVAVESADTVDVEVHEPAACRALRLVAEINDALRLLGKPVAFRLSTATLRVYELLREPVTELTFKGSIDFLYKAFYELARSRRSVDGKKRYLLPAPFDEYYRDAPAVGAISDLRNFVRHDHSQPADEDEANKSFVRAGDRFEAYCGKRAPACEPDWKLVRDGLVEELADLLTDIREGIVAELPSVPR